MSRTRVTFRFRGQESWGFESRKANGSREGIHEVNQTYLVVVYIFSFSSVPFSRCLLSIVSKFEETLTP